MKIRIGSRASKLALIQAQMVADKLDCDYEIIHIITSGDKELSKPLYDIGGKALFIKELEEALLEDKIDIAVHSLKDMPGILPESFTIAAMLEREDPRDALVSKIATNLRDLPKGSVIGTSSPRRIAYLNHISADFKIVNLRGNVDSRVEKVISGEIDATILSYAGLLRLGIAPNPICTPISTYDVIPAPGQGVIAIETLTSNKDKYAFLNHQLTSDLQKGERSYLEHLNADCSAAVAAYARMEYDPKILADDKITMMIDYMKVSEEFKCMFGRSVKGNLSEASRFGREIATWMKG